MCRVVLGQLHPIGFLWEVVTQVLLHLGEILSGLRIVFGTNLTFGVLALLCQFLGLARVVRLAKVAALKVLDLDALSIHLNLGILTNRVGFGFFGLCILLGVLCLVGIRFRVYLSGVCILVGWYFSLNGLVYSISSIVVTEQCSDLACCVMQRKTCSSLSGIVAV
ncbi:hypothetical protein ASF18_11320 [Methylobacterium sp. Leaf89]|nr:hypothetical protein ASF18_11320 [Methylobacterium sp. Leaf89]